MATLAARADEVRQQREADLIRQAALGTRGNKVTPEEARRLHLRIRKEPPKTESCKWCGAELPPEGLVMDGEVIMWKPTPPRCRCEKAQEYWRKYDAKQAEEEEKQRLDRERKELNSRIQRLLADSGLKKRFATRTFENFKCDTEERRRCFEVAKGYADNFKQHRENGEGLYIEGTNGTGKTHLAAAITLQLISEGIPVICKTSGDLLADIKRAYDDQNLQEYAIIDVYRKADLLIIDDLGKEQCSDWAMSTLYTILNDRYEDMKPVIITTNYGAEQLAEALVPKGHDDTKIMAIISRLKEVSEVVTMAWEDYRTT